MSQHYFLPIATFTKLQNNFLATSDAAACKTEIPGKVLLIDNIEINGYLSQQSRL